MGSELEDKRIIRGLSGKQTVHEREISDIIMDRELGEGLLSSTKLNIATVDAIGALMAQLSYTTTIALELLVKIIIQTQGVTDLKGHLVYKQCEKYTLSNPNCSWYGIINAHKEVIKEFFKDAFEESPKDVQVIEELRYGTKRYRVMTFEHTITMYNLVMGIHHLMKLDM